MMKKRSVFDVLVWVAYSFYILLGANRFLMSFASGGHFNYQAFVLMVVFAVQAWYRHRLTNLILGVLTMFLSFFMLMDVLSSYDLLGKNANFDGLAKSLVGMCVFSVIMSGILMFSYLKLSFRDQE